MPQEINGLKDRKREAGEVVAVQVEGDQAGQVLKGPFLNVNKLVSVEVQNLQFHQVAEPGVGHIG